MAEENPKQTVVERVKAEAKNALPPKNSPESLTVLKGEKMLAALGYFEFLCVLPLALKPKSDFCQFHGKQSLVLVILFFVLSLVTLFSRMVGLAGIFSLLFSTIQILLIVLGALNAAKGRKWRIPFVANIADKLNWDE